MQHPDIVWFKSKVDWSIRLILITVPLLQVALLLSSLLRSDFAGEEPYGPGYSSASDDCDERTRRHPSPHPERRRRRASKNSVPPNGILLGSCRQHLPLTNEHFQPRERSAGCNGIGLLTKARPSQACFSFFQGGALTPQRAEYHRPCSF